MLSSSTWKSQQKGKKKPRWISFQEGKEPHRFDVSTQSARIAGVERVVYKEHGLGVLEANFVRMSLGGELPGIPRVINVDELLLRASQGLVQRRQRLGSEENQLFSALFDSAQNSKRKKKRDVSRDCLVSRKEELDGLT